MPGNGSRSGGATRLQVLLFIPNIIGYLRVAATLAAFYLGTTTDDWKVPLGLYFLGFAGDAVDGWAARKWNQSSQYGAVLDMVTDRTATAGLVMLNLLREADRQRQFVWILLVVIDISSHWFHCFSTAKTGHHKSADTLKGRNFLLRVYYGSFPFFAFLCVGQEVFYILNYIFAVDSSPLDIPRPKWLTIPAFLKPYEAQLGLGKHFTFFDKLLIGLWHVAFVGAVLKQLVNLAQLASAGAAFADVDAAEYPAKKESRASREAQAEAAPTAVRVTRSSSRGTKTEADLPPLVRRSPRKAS